MVLRAVKLIVQASLLLQVLQCSASVNGVEVNENFQNTPLSTKDKLKLGTVSAANIPDSQDENIKKQEERGFFDWFSDDDDTPAPASPASCSTPATETGEFATTTPIPGTAARPSTSSLMSKYGSMLGEFTKNSETASEADGSTAGAGSSATTPKTKKPKKPAAAATSATSSGSTSGSDATETTPKRKRTKKRVVAAASASGSEASASGSEATPKTKKPTTKKTKKPVAAAVSSSESEAESGSDDLSDLLSGSTASGSEDLSDLLGSSAGSGSEADMSALLGSGSNDALTALLGSGVGGSGSMLSFEDFMKEYGSMFGSGSSAIDLFGDSSTPQNNTVNDDDILLGELYGGKEHGDAFSDIKNIKFGQMILNITVRGQERVDSIGITVMTQEAVGNLVHGGEGGTEGFIEPTMGDTIDSVEVHWDKNKGKTCIFYLKMTTSGGKTIATGTKTANSAVMKPPKGYQLAGFYGRASSSGIFCIGGIWTKQTATDLAVTDVMAITSKGSPDIYNYETTIRNWKEKALEYANMGDSIVNCPIMVRAEEEDDTMRPCGCHAGRPCTCEMGKKTVSTDSFSCGVCVNCRLDARERSRPRKRSSGPRRCLKSAEYFVELEFDRVVLRGDCVFRMRKPDWNVADKTPLYNQLHQMRLGMTQTRAISLATIDSQKKMRIKLTSDLRKAEDAIKKLETVEQDVAMSVRRMTKDQLCVDSDAFDSFSKQLITAQTLLPDLKVRLEKANATIFTEQQNIKIIREYVRDFAIRKLQSSIRAFFRFRRWKEVLKAFHEDVRLSATLEIQAIWRMFTAKKLRQFLASLLHGKVRSNAANVIRRFSLESIEAKGRKMIIPAQEDEVGILARKQESVDALFGIIGRVILNDALATWKGYTLDARIVAIRKKASAILIQRVYRGFRDRVYLKRIKIRSSLTDRVGALVDKFIVSGDFWGFILEIDADYRRFIHKIAEEEQDAATFMSTVIRQRKLDEDHMMQDWFTASALQNPLVSGIDQVTKMYSEEGNSSGTSVSQAMLQSPLVEDLVALSPNKTKTDIFPPNFPPKVIRQAMAKGFALNEVIAVMRGLQAQRKGIEDADLVLSTLQKRSLLMTNPWTSERVLRESRSLLKALVNSIPVAKPVCKPLKKAAGNRQANSFISANLLESIPGGMNAPIARLLLVAGLSCYDPGSRGEKGRFIPSDDRKSELFQAYLNTESPLVKIRTEQQTMEAVKPFLNILLENRCYTAYDILYNVRGIGELISWNIPGPLAKGIYSVIREIHAQSTHISKRNIIREVRVSADFERFLKSRERKREKLSSPDSKPAKKDSKPGTPTQYPEPEECSALIQVKYRLETETLVLKIRPQQTRIAISYNPS
ncbi:hypothetical protein PC123_g15342 [Phytophthora cactorum]|nr:hypothetical protein PC123_g15342 [Phytophthora cactorum]